MCKKNLHCCEASGLPGSSISPFVHQITSERKAWEAPNITCPSRASSQLMHDEFHRGKWLIEMSKAGSNGSSPVPNKISHWRVSGIPQRVLGTDGVLEWFSPCSTKLGRFWLGGQRKISVTCLHFHSVSQQSVVLQWCLFLSGGWQWITINTNSPIYPTEGARDPGRALTALKDEFWKVPPFLAQRVKDTFPWAWI